VSFLNEYIALISSIDNLGVRCSRQQMPRWGTSRLDVEDQEVVPLQARSADWGVEVEASLRAVEL